MTMETTGRPPGDHWETTGRAPSACFAAGRLFVRGVGRGLLLLPPWSTLRNELHHRRARLEMSCVTVEHA